METAPLKEGRKGTQVWQTLPPHTMHDQVESCKYNKNTALTPSLRTVGMIYSQCPLHFLEDVTTYTEAGDIHPENPNDGQQSLPY